MHVHWLEFEPMAHESAVTDVSPHGWLQSDRKSEPVLWNLEAESVSESGPGRLAARSDAVLFWKAWTVHFSIGQLLQPLWKPSTRSKRLPHDSQNTRFPPKSAPVFLFWYSTHIRTAIEAFLSFSWDRNPNSVWYIFHVFQRSTAALCT